MSISVRDWLLWVAAKAAIGFARGAWEAFWGLVREAIVYAERKWRESGEGARKLEYVLAQVEKWLIGRGIAGWRKRIVLRVVERQLAKAIDRANEELGHDWLQHVDDAERYLAQFIPWIE